MATPKITGSWTSADTSRNHIELAATTEPDVFALRDTYDPQTEITVTRKQLTNLAESARNGPISNMLQQGRR